VTLELTGGQVISQPYIDMTIAMMKTFGVEVVRKTDPETGKLLDIYEIPRAAYKNPPRVQHRIRRQQRNLPSCYRCNYRYHLYHSEHRICVSAR
jgi:hypothetical protein